MYITMQLLHNYIKTAVGNGCRVARFIFCITAKGANKLPGGAVVRGDGNGYLLAGAKVGLVNGLCWAAETLQGESC